MKPTVSTEHCGRGVLKSAIILKCNCLMPPHFRALAAASEHSNVAVATELGRLIFLKVVFY